MGEAGEGVWKTAFCAIGERCRWLAGPARRLGGVLPLLPPSGGPPFAPSVRSLDRSQEMPAHVRDRSVRGETGQRFLLFYPCFLFYLRVSLQPRVRTKLGLIVRLVRSVAYTPRWQNKKKTRLAFRSSNLRSLGWSVSDTHPARREWELGIEGRGAAPCVRLVPQ